MTSGAECASARETGRSRTGGSTAYVFKGRVARPRTRAEVRAARAEVVRDRTRVIARYEAGASLNRLAREYRVTPSWLADTLDHWNIPRHTGPPVDHQ
ncbi:hypothetical protein [Streptomyces sp. NPDC054784]